MLATIAGFFGLSASRLIIYVVAGVAAFGTVTGVYISWKHGIEAKATAEFNQKQLEAVIEDQKKLIVKIEALDKLSTDEIRALKTRLESITKNFTAIDEYLDSELAKSKDRQASEILKKTIEELRKGI